MFLLLQHNNNLTSRILGLLLLVAASVFTLDASAQQVAVDQSVTFVDNFTGALVIEINRLTNGANLAARVLLGIMATLDLAFYVILNMQTIVSQGVASSLPEVFKRLVIWVVLLYGINNFAGAQGAAEIRSIAGDLTGAATVTELGPAKVIADGMNAAFIATSTVDNAIGGESLLNRFFNKFNPLYLVYSLINLIAILTLLIAFATLAVKILLFELGTSLVMLFAGIGFALAAFTPFRHWGSNVLSSAIKMAIHITAVYITALFITTALLAVADDIRTDQIAINVFEAIYIAGGFVMLGFIAIYLAVSLPKLVEGFVGGGGATPGESLGNAVPAISAAIIGATTGLAGASASALMGGGDDEPSGGGDDVGGDSSVSDDVGGSARSGERSAEANSLAARSKQMSSGGSGSAFAEDSGGGDVADDDGGGGGASFSERVLGGAGQAASGAVAGISAAKAGAESAASATDNVVKTAADTNDVPSVGSGGSGSGSENSESNDFSPVGDEYGESELSADDSQGGSKSKVSSSGGGSTSSSGSSGGDVGGDSGNDDEGSATSETSNRDSVVEEVVNDNVRVDKKRGANNIQQSGSDDGEDEAGIATSGGSGSTSRSINQESNSTVNVDTKEKISKTETNSKDED